MKDNPNNWSDYEKVQWHLNHGDGFKNDKNHVTFQGRDYLGYCSYKMTKPIKKLLDLEKVSLLSKVKE